MPGIVLFVFLVVDGSKNRVKSDAMSTSFVFLEGDNTVFTELTYLGSAMVDAPRSEAEISRNMKVLNTQSQQAIPVTLSVPSHSEGIVRSVVMKLFHVVFPACLCSYLLEAIFSHCFYRLPPPPSVQWPFPSESGFFLHLFQKRTQGSNGTSFSELDALPVFHPLVSLSKETESSYSKQ